MPSAHVPARVRFYDEVIAKVRAALKSGGENGHGVRYIGLRLWFERNRGKRPADVDHALDVLLQTGELLEEKNEAGERTFRLPPVKT